MLLTIRKLKTFTANPSVPDTNAYAAIRSVPAAWSAAEPASNATSTSAAMGAAACGGQVVKVSVCSGDRERRKRDERVKPFMAGPAECSRC